MITTTRTDRRLRIALAAAVVASMSVPLGADAAPSPTSPDITQLDIVGPPGSEFYGRQTLVLSNGNFVVADPGHDGVAIDIGAVRLYDGSTNALISTITGSSANDQVGSGRIREVGDSNFIIHSPEWDLDAVETDVGAVTWASGTTGVSGTVDATNSLVGSSMNDQVGGMFGNRIKVLENGNYIVGTASWDDGAKTNVGAATWGDGNSGVMGPVSTANSLHGTAPGNEVGRDVFALANGHYVVGSESWDNGADTDVGAATWGDGTTGTTGPVTIANSLYGTTPFDYVGGGVVALTNGNYVVRSPLWTYDVTEDKAGAATWGDGTTGISGPVTTSNSLHGTVSNEEVSAFGVTPLTNGNYVVHSPFWSNGGLANALGAATWGDGTTGISGPVTSTNSLYGTQAGDEVGLRVTALTNGNYVVGSPFWSFGATANAGAATWGDGAAGVTGPVTASNSLHGVSPNDTVGSRRRALENGNYVIHAPEWDDGANMDVGAVVLGDGRTGSTTGPVTKTNSLYGTTAGDMIGERDVTALATGNYAVASPGWDNGGIVDAGAVTFGDGVTGITGPVSTANSLHGSTAGDAVGDRVTSLTDGDYIVSSPKWDNGGVVDAGAATWVGGSIGLSGPVTTGNSLHGTAPLDMVSDDDDDAFAVPLEGGGYLVGSAFSDAGGGADRGIFTFGNTNGVTGPITASNSVIGTPPGGLYVGYDADGVALTSDDAVVISGGQNRVILMQLDRPPVFTSAQSDITVPAPDGTPQTVSFPTPTATDVRTSATVACLPASGSEFPLGTTTVTCTATDTAGLTNTLEFDVTVGAPDLIPVDPARLLDTRTGPGIATIDGDGMGDGPVADGEFAEVQVAGRGGVPSDATSVMANLAVVGPAAKGFATLYPCTPTPPNASSLNYSASVNIANATLVKLSPTGTACIFSSEAAHYAFDVVGFTPASTLIEPLDPSRLLDTRTGPGIETVDGIGLGAGAVPAGEFVQVRVAGRGGVPADASAVIANIAAIGPSAKGFTTSYPCTTAPPNASSLNYSASVNIANATLIKLSPTGDACFFSSETSDYAVDVVAALPPDADVDALDPTRLLDTRTGPGIETIDGDELGDGPVVGGTSIEVQIAGRGGVPADAGSIVANLAVVGPTAVGFATLYPCSPTPPNASSLNYSADVNIANTTLVKLSPTGTACIFSSDTAHYALDVVAAVG